MKMEKACRWRRWLLFLVFLCFCVSTAYARGSLWNGIRKLATGSSSSRINMDVQERQVVLDNGIVKITLSKPGGMVLQLSYNGITNILDATQRERTRGYWDIVWGQTAEQGNFNLIEGDSFKVISQEEDKIELSFKQTYSPSPSSGDNSLPLDIDKRFIMLAGESGFYTYAIYERLEGWPALDIGQTRITFKLDPTFGYMAIADDKQRVMPTNQDRQQGQPLLYKEAVLVTNSVQKTEVDDKYQYSMDNKDNKVHGWINTDKQVGFWAIMPSNEFNTGGPMKQELTSHVGPTSLAMFHARHYAGTTLKGLNFEDGEPWKKVFGPVFIYLNSGLNTPFSLWNDAKQQSIKESQKWPYNFPMSTDFAHANQRGTVNGRLLINDRFLENSDFPAKFAYVGLAEPGPPGSWQTDAKGYQFWSQTDEAGSFTITNIRSGSYNLYAWVPGVYGDYKYETNVIVSAGDVINLGDVKFNPPRNGPTIWEIGTPDRTAAEFYVPNPDPKLVNPLYINKPVDKYRQYGLWERYTDLYPNQDLVFKIGLNDYKKDWFFAHVTRKVSNDTYTPTTWEISFDLKEVIPTATYTFRLALAASSAANIQVKINDVEGRPIFSTGQIGTDNAIARHGIHGLYWPFSFGIPGNRLVEGTNSVFLTQNRGGSPFAGVMYDYLRLEGPEM